MLDGNWREVVDRGLTPIGQSLQRTGISADVVTVVGTLMAGAATEGEWSPTGFIALMASIASLPPVRERRTPRSLSAVCFPFLSIRAAPSCILGRMLLR